MRIVVQKYGGSSVADLDKLRSVADRIEATREAGSAVVVVVSAMGNTTDELIGLAHQVSKDPDRRELDMLISVGERITMALLAMALRDRGIPARSLTGSQSGIITDEAHADANVIEVRPDRVRTHLEDGFVVIVAGFQGVSRTREVTTLGRGGSDTTAVVLAAALGAEYCEICSDVDGVWSADPRVVPNAAKIDEMALGQALALARGGAKVLFEDAVRYARDAGIAVVASSTFGPGSGTRLTARSSELSESAGIRDEMGGSRVAVAGVVNLNVDLNGANLTEVGQAIQAVGGRLRRRVGEQLQVDTRNVHGGLGALPGGALVVGPVGVVTATGSALGERPELVGQIDAALGERGIGVAACGASGDEAWWMVAEADLQRAVQVAHDVSRRGQ